MEWEDTPPETPDAREEHSSEHGALRALLSQILYRLHAIDRTQVYLVDSIENPPYDISMINHERTELASKSRQLLHSWIYSYRLNSDSDRVSKSNIVVNNILEREKRLSSKSFFSSARNRRKIIAIGFAIGAVIAGAFQGLKALNIIK